MAALVPGEVWEGALGSSLEASPRAGRYLTTVLDFRPLPGVYFLTFDGMVRNHTFEPAGSHFRAHLLIGEEERISLAALGILFSSLFPKTMACCHFHSAYWVTSTELSGTGSILTALIPPHPL